jgi:hypothetical protein
MSSSCCDLYERHSRSDFLFTSVISKQLKAHNLAALIACTTALRIRGLLIETKTSGRHLARGVRHGPSRALKLPAKLRAIGIGNDFGIGVLS